MNWREFLLILNLLPEVLSKVAAPDGVLTGAQFSVPTTVSGNSDAAQFLE